VTDPIWMGGGAFKWEGDLLPCFPPRPSIGLLIGAVLLAAFCSESIPCALAQSPSGRSGTAAINAGVNDPWPAKRTVESASRDAQKAITACDDNVALQCVASELTRYADALREIALERSQEPPVAPQSRRAGCLSRHHRPLPCRR
jgi:hypothetical protein